MVAQNVGVTYDTFSEQPYITVAEYKAAPTAISIDNLVVNGNQAAQDAELHNVILRASSYMDEYFNQNLVATQNVETQRVRMTPAGYISLHPFHNPIVSLEAFEYGVNPNQLYSFDCSQAWFEDQQVIIPMPQLLNNWTSQGPLQFGLPPVGGQIFVKYTYVAGFVNTYIVSAVAGESEMIVANHEGIIAGSMLRIYDGAKSETVFVSDSYVYGSTTVPLTSPLLRDHAAGVATGNLPNAIKEACILITTAFLKMRGASSLSMGVTPRPQGNITNEQRFGTEIKLALDMVDKYRRIR